MVDQKENMTPEATEEQPLPSGASFDQLKDIPKTISDLMASILANLKLQERLYLYKGSSKVGYIEITHTIADTTPLGDEQKIRIVALDQFEAEGAVFEITHSIQVAGDFFTVNFPGFAQVSGTTNGSTILEDGSGFGFTAELGVQHSANDKSFAYTNADFEIGGNYALLPRITSTVRDNTDKSTGGLGTPVKGMIIYNTTLDKAQVYNGTWQNLW